jgi:hypothetical protein
LYFDGVRSLINDSTVSTHKVSSPEKSAIAFPPRLPRIRKSLHVITCETADRQVDGSYQPLDGVKFATGQGALLGDVKNLAPHSL